MARGWGKEEMGRKGNQTKTKREGFRCRSKADFGCLSFPSSATVPPVQTVQDWFVMWWPCPLIDSYDHLASISSQTWCHFLSWTLVLLTAVTVTILVHLVAFWVSFCRLCRQRKVSALICGRQPMPVLHWWQCGKQKVFYCDVIHSKCKPRQRSRCTSYKIFQDSLWSDPGL